MEYRYLGNSGLKISEITYGNWLTHGSQVENDVATQCVRAALDAGISTFDTADVYANTMAEDVLGQALKGERRQSLEIFTKVFGPTGPKGHNDVGLSRKHILESIDGSLTRLQTDYIDLVHPVQHPDLAVVRACRHRAGRADRDRVPHRVGALGRHPEPHLGHRRVHQTPLKERVVPEARRERLAGGVGQPRADGEPLPVDGVPHLGPERPREVRAHQAPGVQDQRDGGVGLLGHLPRVLEAGAVHRVAVTG